CGGVQDAVIARSGSPSRQLALIFLQRATGPARGNCTPYCDPRAAERAEARIARTELLDQICMPAEQATAHRNRTQSRALCEFARSYCLREPTTIGKNHNCGHCPFRHDGCVGSTWRAIQSHSAGHSRHERKTGFDIDFDPAVSFGMVRTSQPWRLAIDRDL